MCVGRERGNEDENMRVGKADRLFFFFFFKSPLYLLYFTVSFRATQLRLDSSLQRLQAESEKFGSVLTGLGNELGRSIKPSKNDE